MGIDEVFVARKLKDLLQALGRRWNPRRDPGKKKGSWKKFEDYRIQLAASREAAKILGMYGPDSEDADRSIRIDISAIPFRRERVSDGEQSTG